MSGSTWLKVWANAWQHPKLALRLTSDSERWAWLVVLSVAKTLDSNGRFESEAHFRLLVPAEYAKHLPRLLAVGLIDEAADGSLTLHDFEDRQAPADSTAAKRSRDYRQRRKAGNPQVDKPVDNDVSRHGQRHGASRRSASRRVTSDGHGAEQNRTDSYTGTEISSPERAREATTDDVPDEDDEGEFDALVKALIMANVWSRPTKAMIGFLANLIRDHSQPSVEVAIADELRADPTPEGFMGRVAGRLRVVARAKNEREERSRVEAETRRLASEQASIEAMRGIVPESVAAERRKAIADFAGMLRSPTTQPEGRQPT